MPIRPRRPRPVTALPASPSFAHLSALLHPAGLRRDEAGGVLAEGGRGSSLDRQQRLDRTSFPIRVMTLDWPMAVKLKVMAGFHA
jgi:hypothetical protein